MADLRVDYQLLASIHATLSNLTWEFENIEDQASAYDPAFGSSDITAAIGSFAGNWSTHRKTMLGTMGNLDRMVAATAQRFHQTDSQLASDLTKK
jgi:conjugal transfer/entry exclusion protein